MGVAQVLLVGRYGRELHVGALGNRAGFGDLSRHDGDAFDLVLGDDRAAREAPDAAVDDAHAEAGRATVADCRLAASAKAAKPAAAASAPAASTPAAAATPASAAEAAEIVEVAVPAVCVHAVVRGAREADVGVRAPSLFGLRQRDVSEALELGLEHLALRRLSDQIADQIACGHRHPRDGHRLYEVTAFHSFVAWPRPEARL